MRFSTNLAKTIKTRREMVDDIEYLVVPTVLIQFEEGENGEPPAIVMNGELLPMNQVCPFVNEWEGKPVPLSHPEQAGQPISAEGLDNPGLFKNVECRNLALQGEYWLEVNKLDANTIAQLESGQPVNVSSAYFADDIPTTGVFNGTPYTAIQQNVRPDHAALLPNEVGACSLDDGCGAPRINSKDESMRKMFTNIELELTEQDMLVWDAWWNQSEKPGRLVMVMNDKVISKAPGKLYIIPYTININTVEFGEPVEADITPIEGEPTTNTQSAACQSGLIERFSNTVVNKVKEIFTMKKPELVQRLAANERCPLDEAALNRLEVNELEELDKAFADEPESQEPEPAAPDEMPAWAKKLAESVESLAAAVKPIQTNAEQERQKLIEEVVASGQFTEDEAKALPPESLVKVHAIVRPVADYSGLGFAANHGGKEADVAKPKSLIGQGGEQ